MTTLTNHSAIPTLGESRTGKVARKTAAATQAKVWGDDQREMLANFLIGKRIDAREARNGSDMTMSESLAIAALDVDRIAADAVCDGYTLFALLAMAAAADLRSEAETYRSQGN